MTDQWERLVIPNPATGSSPGGEPRLYALLAVEVEPKKIVYYHLELDHEPGACVIDMSRDAPDLLDEPLAHAFYGPWRIRAQISGTVVSDRPDYRPPTRTDSTTGPATLEPGPDHA